MAIFWRPRSILQLTLVGFFVAVAPLCIAIFYTIQAFDQLAVNNSRKAQDLVELTRANQILQADLWALERNAGQYVALGDQQLLTLFQGEHNQIMEQLQQLEPMLDKERGFYLLPLTEALERLQVALVAPPTLFNGQATLAQFDQISSLALDLRRASQDFVDQQLQQQVVESQEIKSSLMLMVTSLALFTLFAALFFIYWINRPIRQIERRISQMGSGDLTQEISIVGPQEMQIVGERLDWLRSQLRELDAQKQQFLRHVSHELKTPLASLREGADLLAEGVVGTLDQRQFEIVSIVQQNSRELQRLIENLLDYNQLLYHRELNLESVEFERMWQELIASYAIIIERKSLQVEVMGDPCNWPADAPKIRTALDNLLSNAVNYCPEGGQVDIRWQVREQLLWCQVSNSGQAILEQESERIFEPFYQGRNSRIGAIKGSGIGLSVARECVQAHDGSLDLIENAQL
ncbi:MAG: ATP-binding protein, partial [Motiliproteus sp.]|nr:ATP-binding protein [Motiliproteus sp.]